LKDDTGFTGGAPGMTRGRRKTRAVRYGDVGVGGGHRVSIQSMSTFPASERDGALAQIKALAAAGCEIVRVAVRDACDVDSLKWICGESPIPVVADIHFDHRLAIASIQSGAAGIRINPGNIGSPDRVRAVVDAAGVAGIPVRIGVNSGSLERDLREKYADDPAGALAESALRHMVMIEQTGFRDMVFSLKSADPAETVEANRIFARSNDYPLHVGVTEAGPPLSGTARSVVALTLLLSGGIGDTVRVSLSGDPVKEIVVAAAMLSALGLRKDIPEIISCPTCGRCHIDVAAIAQELETALPRIGRGLKVAVMGCEVNGPGEAANADIGLAGTASGAVLFRKGRVTRKIEGEFLRNLFDEIDALKSGREE